ncbi:alpha/beta hydrolase [Rhizohabitans arisaemae]|uniref:alpha/beta hydrolase n=1 Tax=Rhizohabitans arisaemae TaxID=2720610 RepID=UPI0024B24AB2|nr:alpha/beta hydrolase-fold protein [Rhizohabitans arisaemae]
MTQTTIESARIARFIQAVRDGEAGAVDRLQADLRESAGPLQEETGDGSVLVTFVYIGPGDQVHLYCQLVIDPRQMNKAMTRVEGTEVWYLSHLVTDRRLSVGYRFLVDDPITALSMDDAMVLMQQPDKMTALMDESARCSRDDPYNPDRFDIGMDQYLDPAKPHVTVWTSVLSLPGVDPVTWHGPARLAGATLHTYTFRSEAFGNERTVTVYTPPVPLPEGGDHPVVFLIDGEMMLAEGYADILTNLIAAGEVPPLVGVFVHNVFADSRMLEMSCRQEFVTLYADELMPWLRREYGVTADPARTVVSGSSYGGLSSAWLAYNRSDVFGRVLSMSGSHWWGKRTAYGADSGPYEFGRDDETEWLTRQFATAPLLPVTFWIDAGTLENDPGVDGLSLLSSNRNLRTVLQAKGYQVRYHEFSGGHDTSGWRRTFPLGLRYLLAGDDG